MVASQKTTKNPNRDLDAETVERMFRQELPHLADGLGADRAWLWWSGPKPAAKDREKLVELGWQFSKTEHVLEDGRAARWFHACGGQVIRRRRRAEPESEAARPSPADDPLAALAAEL